MPNVTPPSPEGGSQDVYVQDTEPTETPQPAPDGDGGVWYEQTTNPVVKEWDYLGNGGITPQAYDTTRDNIIAFNRGNVIALDLDGNIRWKHTNPNSTSGGALYSPEQDVVAYGTNQASVIGLDASDGTQLWENSGDFDQFDVDSALLYLPSQELFYFSDSSHVEALNPSDGTSAYALNISYGAGGGYLPTDDYVVIVAGNGDTVEAYDAPTGTQQWTVSAGGGENGRNLIAIDSEDTVVSIHRNGQVNALNDTDGSQIWNISHGSFASGLAYGNGIVAIGNRDGNVTARDVSDGSRVWRFGTGDGISHITYRSETDNFIFSSGDGNLYSVASQTSLDQWKFETESGSAGSFIYRSDIDSIFLDNRRDNLARLNLDVETTDGVYISDGSRWVLRL